ncbi:uncharacterized protein LOC130677706 [Microplitis mediator]|uniref:uncharacterized protein LOC130677706 n=1 Tax=Microplitis mediator TaxID=375433 RepID=UPI00255612E3|nr:uncharacterized protein LOC130677706 [Microplitis mediator]XP_057340537.1 uncharacterized protein LOC130677706 [Microplitis mediator]
MNKFLVPILVLLIISLANAEICDHDSMDIDGACVKVVGNSCTNDADCRRNDAACLEGTCQWVQNWMANKERHGSYVAKALGDVCIGNKHCRELSGAVCVQFRCVTAASLPKSD